MTGRTAFLLYHAAIALAAGALLFALLMGARLLVIQSNGAIPTLLDSPALKKLQAELRANPKNEELKRRIRAADLTLRQQLFARLHESGAATRAVLYGSIIAAAAWHLARTLRKRLPDPTAWGPRSAERDLAMRRRARLAVAAGLLMGLASGALATRYPAALPAIAAAPEASADRPTPPAAAPDEPAPGEFLANWPQFRGPAGAGILASGRMPMAWDTATGAGIRWRTPVPLSGTGSPILWGNRVYLTGADAQHRRVFAFEADNGKLLWSADIVAPGARPPEQSSVDEKTGQAAPTPVTDGRRIFAIFADGTVGAVDRDGKPLWSLNVGPLDNPYGHASSPILSGDLLILQLYQRNEASKLIALRKDSGVTAWSVAVPAMPSWTTPLALDEGGSVQLITVGDPWVFSMDALTGRERWRAKCVQGEIAPSPVAAPGGLVVVCSSYDTLALRADAQGDVSASEPAWKTDVALDITSPLVLGDRVYLLETGGRLHCHDAADGAEKWAHDVEGEFYASPAAAGGTLVLWNRAGTAWFVEAGDEFRALGHAALGEAVNASPILRDGRMIVRGERTLFCLEAGTSDPPEPRGAP